MVHCNAHIGRPQRLDIAGFQRIVRPGTTAEERAVGHKADNEELQKHLKHENLGNFARKRAEMIKRGTKGGSLNDTNLSKRRLPGVVLDNLSMHNTNWRESELIGASMRRVYGHNSDWRCAQLMRATIEPKTPRAIKGARFGGADLTGATFINLDCSTVRGLRKNPTRKKAKFINCTHVP